MRYFSLMDGRTDKQGETRSRKCICQNIFVKMYLSKFVCQNLFFKIVFVRMCMYPYIYTKGFPFSPKPPIVGDQTRSNNALPPPLNGYGGYWLIVFLKHVWIPQT